MNANYEMSEGMQIWNSFRKNRFAMFGLCIISALFLIAVYAPFLVNPAPLLVASASGGLSFPFLKFIFAPDTQEHFIDTFFNMLIILIPVFFIISILLGKCRPAVRISILLLALIVISLPYLFVRHTIDNKITMSAGRGVKLEVSAMIKYSPNEVSGQPYETSSVSHLLGTDNIGRDLAARLVYGTRVSFAVGFFATLISLVLGTSIGLISGYYGGKTDLVIMRIIEIVICFPAFLLLLILAAVLMDMKFEQSSVIIVLIIGFLGWTGLSRIVRGEVLKQRSLPYIQSCRIFGMSGVRTMFIHILPNVSAPILVTAVLMIASNILAESGLSFLGFGVQPPTATWGEILNEAFIDPLRYWNLTLWPGFLIFVSIFSINIVGEGLRKAVKLN